MDFDAIVFDLDGTVWDTTEACAVAWGEVVADHGVDFRTNARPAERSTRAWSRA